MARILEFDEQDAIRKAMEVFWKKGYNGASMRDLTAAMDINASSLYRSLGDKHALFVKCIKNYTEGRMEEARKLVAREKSPLKALVDYINNAASAITAGSDSCLAIKTTFEVATGDPAVQQVLKADNDFSYELLLSLLRKAITLGELSNQTDPETLADHIMSSFTGWHESFILYKDKERILRMAQWLIQQLH